VVGKSAFGRYQAEQMSPAKWIPAAIIPAKIAGLQTGLSTSKITPLRGIRNKLMEAFETLSGNPTSKPIKKHPRWSQVSQFDHQRTKTHLSNKNHNQ
jgi:hypothetical protein